MGIKRYLIFAICIALTSLKIGVIAAPTKTQDCSKPIHLEETDCCRLKSAGSFQEPNLNQECVNALVDTKVSTYDDLEDALECFFECLFSTVDYLTEDKKIDYEKLQADIENEFKEDSSNFPVDKIKQCVENDYVIKESSKCQSGSLQFFLCGHREQMLNCPAHDWKNTTECNEYKLALENCPEKTPIFQLF
nr:odorant-binding protein [Plautia stali]